MAEVGDLHVATVVLNVQDMRRAVGFWTAALGYEPRESGWDDEFMMLVDPKGGGLPVSLQRTDRRPAEPVRGHLDLYTTSRDDHVRRLRELGASEPPTWPYPAERDFVVLRDTEGNEFCVIQHEPIRLGVTG
jgi:catechol 2,3-dioxygenase-like lactoylglutathione lyase family enzyme